MNRPVILAGMGATEAMPLLIEQAEKHSIPILTTWPAIDLIPWNHPNFIGRPGVVATRAANLVIHHCDRLYALGARLDAGVVVYDYRRFALHAELCLVDIDAGEMDRVPRPGLEIHQEVGSFLESQAFDGWAIFPDWLHQCQAWKAQYGIEGTTISYQLCRALNELLTADTDLVIGTSCMFTPIFSAFYQQKAGQRVIAASTGLGSMGAALPSAIGVALASGKRVICLDGDGSFMQNVQELEVVRRLNLPITLIILNNHGYASIRNSETRAFGRLSGADTESGFSLPSISRIAGAFEIPNCWLRTVKSLRTYLNRPGPQILELMAPPDEVLLPRITGPQDDFANMWPRPA